MLMRVLTAGLMLALALTMAPGALAKDPPDPTIWRRLDPENTLYIDVTQGRIVLELFPEIAPAHVARVKELARERFYDGLAFHRVIDGFMAQGGDPLGDGTGGSTKPDLPAEFTFKRGPEMPFIEAAQPQGQRVGFYKSLPVATQPDAVMEIRADGAAIAWGLHCPGVASMARGRDPGSANSQFFLMRAPYPTLDRNYTVWGKAIWGQEAINALTVRQPHDPSDPKSNPNPPPPSRIIAMRVAADLPAEEQAPIYLMRTESPKFLDEIEEVRRKRGADFSVCDVAAPVRVPEEMLPADARKRAWWRGVIPFF